jgi:hypothetical protein
MALSQKHRSTIYQRLQPILGEEESEALLSHFPARDLDEPVTKEFVHAEIANVRTEISNLRSDLTNRLTAVIAAGTSVVLVAIGLLGFFG